MFLRPIRVDHNENVNSVARSNLHAREQNGAVLHLQRGMLEGLNSTGRIVIRDGDRIRGRRHGQR